MYAKYAYQDKHDTILYVKISAISAGDRITDTAMTTWFVAFITEGVKFQVEVSENKDVSFYFPIQGHRSTEFFQG